MNIRVIQIIVGLACSFFFLAFSLYRVQFASVGTALTHADPVWIGAALFIYAANLSLRARRWQIILRPVAAIPYPIVARALLVGYGLNTIMPARLGELFRAEFCKKRFGLSRVWALTSIVIERLFDGVTVIACLGTGLLLTAATPQHTEMLIDVLLIGSIFFGMILLSAFCLSGSAASRIFRRFPQLSARMNMVQRGFGILRTSRTLEVASFTFMIYLPDALSLWCVVKAVGLALSFADTLVLVGVVSLSTLVPSGPAFLGTLQFAYALVIELTGAPRALGIAAATLVQLCLLLPVAVIGVGVLAHGSGSLLYDIVTKRESKDTLSTSEDHPMRS